MRQSEKRLRQWFAVGAIFLFVVSSLSGAETAAAFPAGPGMRPPGSDVSSTAQIRQIAAETSAIRSLKFLQPMQPVFIDRDQLRNDYSSYLDDYTAEEQYAEERVIVDFQLAPEGIDLRQLSDIRT